MTRRQVTLPDEVAKSVVSLRDELSRRLATSDLATGWTPAHSLSSAEAQQTFGLHHLFGFHDGRTPTRRILVVD